MTFPVKDKFQARQVTELDFEIDPQDPRLYVDFDPLKRSEYLDEIKFILNIDDNDVLVRPTDTYVKILFSGHRGCGKTTELHRFQSYIDTPGRYCSIFIDMEKQTDITTFQPEDLFVALILNLVEKIKEKDVVYESGELTDIMKEWLSEETIQKELKTSYGLDLSTEMEAGYGFFGFLKLQSKFKALFSSSSNTASTIREKVKRNPHLLIDRFNSALDEARRAVCNGGHGCDILYIIDGFEKMPLPIFEQIFIKDSALIRKLGANIIFTIPINSYLDIKSNPSADFFQQYILPMIPVHDDSRPLLADIVAKRMDRDTFFAPGALELCVEKSGGCPRQLLRVVNKALVIRRGEMITTDAVLAACKALGQEMLDRLDSDHRKVLTTQTFDTADTKVRELLFSLAILKYNGTRKINPLIEDSFSPAQASESQ